MVKELEDAPRDEVAVLLDGETAAGFDLAVRAAGSILHAYVRRGRRCVLVVNSAMREVHHVHPDSREWRHALELLAAVEPTAPQPAAALLSRDSSAAARALELVVVTARPSPSLVDRLVQRVLSRRGAALVHVEDARRPEPGLLRLQAAGVPVAVVREGDDLAAALSAAPLERVAHA
jgi:DNA-binding LacI/PurR family transcriptional regulator